MVDTIDLISWFDTSEVIPRGTDFLSKFLDKVWGIQDRLWVSQSRKKSYANCRLRALKFGVGDGVFFQVFPLKGMMKFGRQFSPRYIRSFKILRTFGVMDYKLTLPPNFSATHQIFHVSLLWCKIMNDLHVFHLELVYLDEMLNFVEDLVSILTRDVIQL